MPKQTSTDTAARKERMAALAREEKAALAALDRASARLAVARIRREAVVARADEELAAAEAVRHAALGAYARHAGPERAAVTLGEDVRELRRLARETDSPAPPNGRAGTGDATAARHRRARSDGSGG